MGLRGFTSDQRLAPILGVGIALIAGATLVAYAVVGRQVGSSLRDSRSVERVTQRVTVVASRDPQPIVLPAPEVETPAQKPQPVTTETVELVAQAPSNTETSTEPETFSGGISGEVNSGLTDRIIGSIGEFVRRGKIGPSAGPDAPWGAASAGDPQDGLGSHTGGIEGDAIGSESDEGSPPAEDAEEEEWDWNEPGGNDGKGSDSDDSSNSSSDTPDDDGPSSDHGSEEAKEDDDDYDWPDGDDDDGKGKGQGDDSKDNDSDDSGSSSASSGSS